MKRFLILGLALMSFIFTQAVEAKSISTNDVPALGFKILQANNVQKRMVFKTTSGIRNPRATLDYKPESIGLDTTGRVLWVYGDALNLIDNEDELAGLLSYGIAIGENSYKGTFRGFFSNFSYSMNPRPKENQYDKKAVDYMVKAGYNPVALITFYSKSLSQTRYEWCHYYPLATKRMVDVYSYIYKNYPQCLKNNVYENNVYYQNFLATTQKEMTKAQKKLDKNR